MEVEELQSLIESANERECSSTAKIAKLEGEVQGATSRLLASETTTACREKEA
jgi:hypothetical protein